MTGADVIPLSSKRATCATGATGQIARPPVSGLALAGQVRDAFTRHIVFHSDYADAESGTIALWTMHTWVYDVFGATPYIMVTAPTSEAGKSRVFDVLGLLVRSPYKVVDPTPAALYSDIDELRPTVLLDEADMLRESKAMKVILNAGFQPGTPKRIKGRAYELFCPKAFSGIAGDRQPLTDATLSRCIQIPMRRKAPHEHVEAFHAGTATVRLAPVRGELEAWAEGARGALHRAEPSMPDGLSDRQRDCWEPLLAIADLTGWGPEAREWAVTLTKAIPKIPDEGVQILRDVRRVIEQDDFRDATWIATSVLAERRNALEAREYAGELNSTQLGRRLSGFGISADHSPRRDGGRNAPAQRGFTIRVRRGGEYTAPWKDAFTRYEV
jgi:Protein of unknown function (DUF3631)